MDNPVQEPVKSKSGDLRTSKKQNKTESTQNSGETPQEKPTNELTKSGKRRMFGLFSSSKSKKEDSSSDPVKKDKKSKNEEPKSLIRKDQLEVEVIAPRPELKNFKVNDKGLIQLDQENVKKYVDPALKSTFEGAPQDRLEIAQTLTKWEIQTEVKGTCAICLCPFEEDDGPIVQLSQCQGHQFHQNCVSHCLHSSNSFLKCPTCSFVYGIKVGNMPKGNMEVLKTWNYQCDGHVRCGTIVIRYSFADGIQGPDHPKPGAPYYGTKRTCYLPDDKEGNEVLRLFTIAFERKLTFTIGQSLTSGKQNAVTWNGIHHKTSLGGGPTNYGYPDFGYFKRVKEELAHHGVH